MRAESVLGLLGIALRGGKLALGEQPVADMAEAKKARVILLACDAAENSKKRARALSERFGVPLLEMPCSKEQLGGALGRASLAVCAVTDMGIAVAAAKQLAEEDAALLPIAQAMAEKQSRMKKRKHKNKNQKQMKKIVEGEATDSMSK